MGAFWPPPPPKYVLAFFPLSEFLGPNPAPKIPEQPRAGAGMAAVVEQRQKKEKKRSPAAEKKTITSAKEKQSPGQKKTFT